MVFEEVIGMNASVWQLAWQAMVRPKKIFVFLRGEV